MRVSAMWVSLWSLLYRLWTIARCSNSVRVQNETCLFWTSVINNLMTTYFNVFLISDFMDWTRKTIIKAETSVWFIWIMKLLKILRTLSHKGQVPFGFQYLSLNSLWFLLSSLIAFVRSCHLRKRTTYLIINVTVADLLVGVVSGPLGIYFTYEMEHARHGFSWRVFSILTLSKLFSGLFLLNLSLRAVVSNFRESGEFLFICPKVPFWWTIFKINI